MFIQLDNSITYIIGAACIILGVIGFVPGLATKVFKNEVRSRKQQIAGAVFLTILGIVLLIVARMNILF